MLNRRACIIILIFGLLILKPGVLSAQRFGDIDITVHTHPEKTSIHGYFEYRMTVFNQSIDTSHRVMIELPFDQQSPRGNYIRSIRRAVTVAPRAKAHVSIFQPSLPLRGHRGRISVDGVAIAKALDIKRSSHASYFNKKQVILVSRSLNRDNLESQLVNLFNSNPKRKKREKRKKPVETLIRAQYDIKAWSTHWLGYSRYDGVLMSAADWRGASQPVTTALTAYIKSGGSITILGDFDPDAVANLKKRESQHDMAIYAAGFGRLIAAPAFRVDELNDAQLNYMQHEWRVSQLPFVQIANESMANKAFPIIEGFDIDLKALLLIMLVFVLLAGPLNLFILHVRKKKIWLIATFPLIALFTAASVFGYVLISEGLEADVKISGVTLLDQIRHEAVSLGIAAYYCRMTPADGLHFSNQTEITPLVNRNYYQAGAARTIDQTTHQHLETGWITARVPSHFLVRKIEKRRERLQVTRRPDGRPEVVNGLGGVLKCLVLINARKEIFQGVQIPAGARVVLDPASAEFTNARALQQRFKALCGGDAFETPKPLQSFLTQRNPQMTIQNTYIGLLSGGGFIEKGLAEPDNLEINHLILGSLDPSNPHAKD